MRLIITIDTEEDNWIGYECSSYTTENAGRLAPLQTLFDEFAIRPTYLASYVMVEDPVAAEFLREIRTTGRGEIGAHCHPWNTPPTSEERHARNSMLCNLTPALQFAKIRALTEAITGRLGTQPVSFRAGRWAYSLDVGRSLARLGYRVDSSITPYYDWSVEYGPDFSGFALVPYWKSLHELYGSSRAEPVVEIPATVGYLQRDFRRADKIRRLLVKQPFRCLKLYGILYQMGLLNRIWLCPEHHTAAEMIRLTEVLRRKAFPMVNLMFHSPTLQAGLTPFVRTVADERAFAARIRQYLEYAQGAGLESVTLAEAAAPL